MNRRYKNSNFKEIIISHIEENFRYYAIFLIIFFIGIIIGTVFINSVSETGKQEITEYINNFISSLKEKEINSFSLLRISIRSNCILGLILWFMGSTVIGILIVAGIIGFRGFCLGYTISSIVAVYGIGKGILFLLITLFLQNIIFIPAIIAISVSGANFCSNIFKGIKKANIKKELLKHTIFCSIMQILLIISSLIEIFISKNLLIFLIKYF